MKRNPKWHWDELILALDLYFKLEDTTFSAQSPEIIELSEILNSLDIYPQRKDLIKFRNPNGVYMKLMNFRSIDPNYPGKGLERGGKLEVEVWNRCASNKTMLTEAAKDIRRRSRNIFQVAEDD